MSSNEKTSAGKWSVALAIVPTAIVILFIIIIKILTTNLSSESAGNASIVTFGIVFFASHIIALTSLLGVNIGFFAVRKSNGKKGSAGILLNLSTLILACICLAFGYLMIGREIDI
jgi:hypothetical protein